MTQHKNISDATADLIDQEIRALIDDAETNARKILSDELDKLHAVAEALLEYETLAGPEVEGLLNGVQIVRSSEPDDTEGDAGKTSSVPSTGVAGESDLSPNIPPGG